jgi:phytoene synthase
MSDLAAAYDVCRRLNARHGRTYYLATLLLPRQKRPAVHALYAFARWVDDVVDDTSRPGKDRAQRLADARHRFHSGDRDHPVLAAVQHTIDTWRIDRALFDAFFRSMEMDLHVREYATWEDLLDYMDGSAAAIGLQLLPVLGTAPGTAAAAVPYARDLGLAFQLTNFVRDVGEDLDRDRVYLPKEDLAAFGVSRADLDAGVVDGPMRRLLAFEIARARELYRAAAPGIRLLDRSSRDCVRTAYTLYAGILDAVEAADYRVLDRRAQVSRARRAAVALPAWARAVRARRR